MRTYGFRIRPGALLPARIVPLFVRRRFAAGMAILVSSLLLLSVDGFAGVVRPNVTEGDWMNDESWVWRSDYQSTDTIAQVPQSGDIVFLALSAGTIIKLSEPAPKLHEITIGNATDTAPISRLVLASGAVLETGILVVGRPGGSIPSNGGILEIEDGAVCNVVFKAIVGGQKDNLSVSNGTLLLRGGEFTTKTLLSGHGGKGSGSLISIKGQKSQLAVTHKAEIAGANADRKACGTTLEFLFDKSGISPLLISGDLELKDLPGLRIDFADYEEGKPPAAICLIRVEGMRSGDFAKPEFLHLPKGILASVSWDADNSLILALSR